MEISETDETTHCSIQFLFAPLDSAHRGVRQARRLDAFRMVPGRAGLALGSDRPQRRPGPDGPRGCRHFSLVVTAPPTRLVLTRYPSDRENRYIHQNSLALSVEKSRKASVPSCKTLSPFYRTVPSNVGPKKRGKTKKEKSRWRGRGSRGHAFRPRLRLRLRHREPGLHDGKRRDAGAAGRRER